MAGIGGRYHISGIYYRQMLELESHCNISILACVLNQLAYSVLALMIHGIILFFSHLNLNSHVILQSMVNISIHNRKL